MPSTDCLKLQMSPGGTVWYGDDTHVAADSNRAPAEFFDVHGAYWDSSQVWLLGRADNACLVEALYDHRARVPPASRVSLPRVMLGSPTICPAGNGKGPADVLTCVWHANACADAVGSWHEARPVDYATYALVAAVRGACGPNLPDRAARMLQYHPAWPAVSFTGSPVPVDACCRLLAEVVDVRWFRHPSKPHRCSKLFEYLGLTRENAEAAVAGRRHGGHHYDRALLAFAAWLGRPADLVTSEGLMTPRSDRDFLRRVFAASGDPARGLLLATRRYVQFVRDVWLAGRADQPDMFDPEMFFRGDAEVEAYRAHCRSLAPS